MSMRASAGRYARALLDALSGHHGLRTLLADHGVSVHAVLSGPVDTDMSRDLDIPKASARSVATAIFDGCERGDDHCPQHTGGPDCRALGRVAGGG